MAYPIAPPNFGAQNVVPPDGGAHPESPRDCKTLPIAIPEHGAQSAAPAGQRAQPEDLTNNRL